MSKTSVFIGILLFGVLGRWVIVPSISKIKGQRDYAKQNDQKFESCLDSHNCSLNELFNPYFLKDDQFNIAYQYLLEKYDFFSKQDLGKTIFLRAQFINDPKSALTYFSSLDSDGKNTFAKSLFRCTHNKCLIFIDQNLELIKDEILWINYLKLRLKINGNSWKDKNLDLDQIITKFVDEENIDELVEVIEIIPNHPKLRSAIEKNFLFIRDSLNLSKSVVHLSRYNRGWHDRTYENVLSSNSFKHIEAFIKTMSIDCPQKLSAIYGLIEIIKDEAIWSIALEQAYYLFTPDSDFAQKYKLDILKFIPEAKCTTKNHFI